MKRKVISLVLLLALTLTGCVRPGAMTIETEEPSLHTDGRPETTEPAVPTEMPTEMPTEAPTEAPTEPAETEAPQTEATEPDSGESGESQPETPKLTARQAFVYDCEKEEFLFLHGSEDDAVYPASTTKLFTAWIALQHLAPDQILTVGSEISFLEWEASTAGLQVGDQMTTAAMIKCMLMPSGCDAAYVLAASAGREIAGDPELPPREAVDYFMDEMNRVAAERGWGNTRFITPDGYHRTYHYISLKAYVDIGKLCVSNETILDATRQYHNTVEYADGRTNTLTNLNEILNEQSPYYRPDCRGLKTGRTNAAGSCMMAAFWEEDHYVLVGIFGSANMTDRYSEAVMLYDHYVKGI